MNFRGLSVGLSLILFSVVVLAAPGALAQQDLIAEENTFTGPNCFNTALRFLGLQRTRRHVREAEINLIVRDHCARSQPMVGQTLSLLRNTATGQIVHAFVRLDDQNVLTKNGLSKRAPNEIQKFDVMMQIHQTAQRNALSVEDYLCTPLRVFSVESIMHFIQAERERAYSPDLQSLYLSTLQMTVAPSDREECRYLQSVMNSLNDSWIFIEQSSITPEESKMLKDFITKIQQVQILCPRSDRHRGAR